jgi:hypothetical protein
MSLIARIVFVFAAQVAMLGAAAVPAIFAAFLDAFVIVLKLAPGHSIFSKTRFLNSLKPALPSLLCVSVSGGVIACRSRFRDGSSLKAIWEDLYVQ